MAKGPRRDGFVGAGPTGSRGANSSHAKKLPA